MRVKFKPISLKPVTRFVKSHKKVLAISLVGILAAGVAGGLALHRRAAAAPSAEKELAFARTIIVEKGTLNESVSVAGTVESAEVSSVTTTLTGKVTAVNVKVGDQVKKGDVICTLDDTDIRKELADKRQSIGEEQERLKDMYNKALVQVQTARSARQSEQGVQDARVDKARQTLNAADAALKAAAPAYEAAKANLKTAQSATAAAQAALDAAKAAAQTAYNTWIAAGGAAQGPQYAAHQAAQAEVAARQTAFDSAKVLYKYDSYAAAMAAAQGTYDPAAAARQEAQSLYDQAVALRQQTLDGLDSAINTAVATAQDAQKQMKRGVSAKEVNEIEKRLEATVLKAETNGKVTELKVTVGGLCKGEAATIQSADKLLVAVKIPEYAIGRVAVGMKAVITGDSLKAPAAGTLSRISPTAASGDSSGFSADIAVSAPEGIFIGSKVKAEIIISSKSNVFTVPLDAVRQNAAGQDVVLVKQTDGTFAEKPVTLGSKNDYYTEISGEGAVAGSEVLANAAQNAGGDAQFAGSGTPDSAQDAGTQTETKA